MESKNLKTPSFILDVHLGRLARDLRMLGLDCLWNSSFRDSQLLSISKVEGRFLLTRDRALHTSASNTSPAIPSYYVIAIHPHDQIREIVNQFSLQNLIETEQGFLSRCLECNTFLLTIEPNRAQSLIPDAVLKRYKEFFLCPGCQKIYWKGSHFDRMRERLPGLK